MKCNKCNSENVEERMIYEGRHEFVYCNECGDFNTDYIKTNETILKACAKSVLDELVPSTYSLHDSKCRGGGRIIMIYKNSKHTVKKFYCTVGALYPDLKLRICKVKRAKRGFSVQINGQPMTNTVGYKGWEHIVKTNSINK